MEQINMLLHCGVGGTDRDKCTSHFSEDESDNVL